MNRHRVGADRGASLIMVAIALLLLMGMVAVAIDLAAIRLDRSADQKVTDSSASAGALAALQAGGQEACEGALAYVVVNAEGIGSVDDSGCAAFSSTCDPAVAESHTVVSGRFTITITHPVPDSHPLMTSGILGAPTQSVVADDGDPCQRVVVEMSAVHEGLFAQLLGFDQGTTTVHTVATAEQPSGEGFPLNLLVLDRFGCQALHVQGNGGVIVNAVINEDNTGLLQGLAAADSDASSGCNGVIQIDGSNGLLRSDGPPCPGEVGSGTVGGFTSGLGCGLIQTIAPGTPGCNTPACVPGAGGANPPIPDPTAMPGRLTRAPIDHRYNCWPDYTSPPAGLGWATDPLTSANEQDIPGCSAGDPDHIYDLINSVGSSGGAGFSSWNADLGHNCTQNSSDSDITIGGNVHIDCANFIVRNHITIQGDVILDGDVSVTSADGHLDVQNTLGSPGWAFFRDGTLTKDGQASLTFNYTAVYMSKTSRVAMSGGGGSLNWIAPDSGDFDDLALWSDSPLVHTWAGQANLNMEGVFFTPLATADYAGTAGQNQTKAQWIADKLVARGQGVLVIQPEFGRAVEFPVSPRTTLIR